MKRTFLFVTIASILSINAYADPATITTQDYVDNNFQEKIPAGSFGANYSVVTYGANAGNVEERLIIDATSDSWWSENIIKNYTAGGGLMSDDAKLYGMYSLNATNEQYENALLPAKYISYGLDRKQYKITPGTTGSVAIFNGTAAGGSAKFTEKAISNSATYNNGTLTNGDNIASISAVETKQNKMTCTRWLNNIETDENCLLWSIE